MKNELKNWEKQKELIPVMIRMYCHGNHHTKGKKMCASCQELTDYALFRLDKCPFKKNKSFCAFCSIKCYKPEYKAEIKKVMKYSGPRMFWTHPIFSMSHVVQMIKYKKAQKKKAKEAETKQKEVEALETK